MNAYELADDLESYDWYYEHEVTGADGYTQEIKTCNTEYVWDAANMLRQQADRIAELEKQSEPVAWVYETENVDGEPYLTDVSLKPLFGLVTRYGYKEIPLYTTPQTKPLSFDVMVELGKEVDAVWDVNINGSVWFPSVDAFESFCRAILRKAQEK